MSFLNLLGGGRRHPTPPRPLAATAQTDAIHAQLSNPSKQGSKGTSTPVGHDRKRPTRAQTDSLAFSDHTSRSSQSLTTDLDKKPILGRRNEPSKVIASSLRSSPSVSTISLVETQEGGDGIIYPSLDASNTPTPTRSLKTSPSLEQEWMEVEKDSSDEDGFSNTQGVGSLPSNKSRHDSQSSSKPLYESGILVEDEHVKARRLAAELSAAEEKLRGIKQQNEKLQQQLEDFEREGKAKAGQLKTLKETTDADRIKMARDNATAMEIKRREIQELQGLLDRLRLESKVWEEKVEGLVRENQGLREEVVNLEGQSKHEGEELDAMKKEVDAANTALRTFRERSKATIGTEREENKRLKDKADDLLRQLEALEQHSKERDAHIHELQQAGQSSDHAFRMVQAAADEKDRAFSASQRQVAALEKQKDNLLARIVEMETEVEEAKNASQRLLARAREEHKQEVARANDRIRSLQNEVNSSSANAEKLLSTLKVSNADAANAIRLANDRAVEIERLQEQLGIVEEELHSKEQELIDSKAGRASQSHLEARIRDLNAIIEKLKADHFTERNLFEEEAANERARITTLEREVSSSRDKIRELRTRYEASEQSRRIMKDQLARREEEIRNRRRESAGGFDLSASIIREPTQPSNDQLLNLLQNLNYEIFQTSALLADSLSLINRPTSSDDTNAIDIDDETTSLLGIHLLTLVRSQSNVPLDSYDPYPLQTAIQATFICCATRVMTAWYPGYWEHSDFLAATYARIREAEGIAASDAWKAMTRARLRPTTGTIGRVVEFFEECLTTIFRYAGWPTSKATTSTGPGATATLEETIDSLLRENREKLSSLARHSLRINVLLDSVSPELEPAFVEPGSVFDPEVMDRDDVSSAGSQRPDDSDEVISTSEIGLRKVIVDRKGSSSSRRRVVLKPKVILRSSFEA